VGTKFVPQQFPGCRDLWENERFAGCVFVD
jgi:hypothetical protein